MKPYGRPALAALLAALVLPSLVQGGELVDQILVHVNSRIVTQSSFDARVETVLREAPAGLDAARREEVKKSVLTELVHEALLEDRARELDVVATDAEIEDQVRRLKEQNQVKTDEEFARALAASNLTIDKLREQLQRSLTVQRVVAREVNSKVDLSDDALRGIYEREKESYRIEERARVAEVLVSPGPGAEAKAREAYDAVKGGAKFEDVAARLSDGPSKSRGGDLGSVAKGELAAELDKVVFSLPTGGISEPVLTKSGWHVIRVKERLPVTYKPFSEVKADILKREQDTQFQKKLAEYLDKLERDAVIRVMPEAQAYYRPPAPAPAIQDASAPRPRREGRSSGSRLTLREPRFEITPTVGYRLGGTASTYYNEYIDGLDVASALSFGLTLEYGLRRDVNLELIWSHQDTELSASFLKPLPEGYSDRITHLNVDTIQIGALWQRGRDGDKIRPYLDLLLGVSILTPAPQFSTLTRFSGSVGGGAKLRLSDSLSTRLGVRFMPIYLNSQNAGYAYCDPWYGCYTYYDSNYLLQWDFYTGLTYRF